MGDFVELEGSKCEGMVSLKYLDDDFYYLDDENYRVIGQHYGREFKLGDKVKVKVLQVDLQKKQMDFVLDAEPVEPMFRPNSKRNRKFK